MIPRSRAAMSSSAAAPLYFQRSKWSLSSVVLPFAALTFLPVLWIVTSWASVSWDLWQHLWDTQLTGLIWNTLRLAFGVFIGTSLLGTCLAWVVSRYEFPGRAFFEWALVLPFAIPAYVFAFIVVGTFDGASTTMMQFRNWSGLDIWPNIRNYWGVLLSFIFAFYPYVYLLVRSTLKRQGQEMYEVAQTLGCHQFSLLYRVALPVAWPAIVTGAGLSVMEALADFGAVAIFNYNTFTTAIYKSWFGFFSIQTAAQLATFLIVAVILWRSLEAGLLYGREPHREKSAKTKPLERVKCGPIARWCCFFSFSMLLLLTVGVPLWRLISWAIEAWDKQVLEHFIGHLGHSLVLALSGGVLVVLGALVLSLAARLDARQRVLMGVRCATLGYALPGSILAVGLMLAFAFLEKKLQYLGVNVVLIGTPAVLLIAYVVRFMAVGFSGTSTALTEIQPFLGEAAQVLGVSLRRRCASIYAPLMAPGLMATLLLVSVDILKEMPATLLLRPLGWDTLAVSIFGYTSEGDWAYAALPSIALVFIGLIPVYILVKRY